MNSQISINVSLIGPHRGTRRQTLVFRACKRPNPIGSYILHIFLHLYSFDNVAFFIFMVNSSCISNKVFVMLVKIFINNIYVGSKHILCQLNILILLK
jgi:hypothetical protein